MFLLMVGSLAGGFGVGVGDGRLAVVGLVVGGVRVVADVVVSWVVLDGVSGERRSAAVEFVCGGRLVSWPARWFLRGL